LQASELRKLTLLEIASLIRSEEFSPTDLARLVLEQIRHTDNRVKAYVTVCDEKDLLIQAEASGQRLKSHQAAGQLDGIPISVKDNFETEGLRTTCGSKLFRDYIPSQDCTVVKRLKQAGTIILGKLNTHEFALGGISPPTRNPWNLDHIPGGSSGGSAAAIAVGSAVVATGSDTTGSIRLPASFCGVVGLKPTYSRVSRAGVFPNSWSLDHVGPITKHVEDAALLLEIIAGYDEDDPTSSERPVPQYVAGLKAGITGLRVGIPKNYFFERCNEDVKKAVMKAIDLLVDLDCEVIDFEFPLIKEITTAYSTISLCETTSYHEQEIAQRPKDFQPDVKALLERGLFIPATHYIKALRIRAMVFREVMKLFKNFDVIVTPSAPMTAPPVGQNFVTFEDRHERLDIAMFRYLGPFNLIGLPALSIPCGFSNRLPMGMQIVGRPFEEETVLRVGNAYEKSTLWHLESPEVEE